MPMDPRVDRYIEDAQAFAQPVLGRLRKLVHKACPEAEENIKWSRLADLPPDKDMLRYLREACRLLGASLLHPAPSKPAKPRNPEAEVPRDLAAALAGNRAASQAFHRFSPSHRREYTEWIAEAKRDETRQKRTATALEWLAEGKPRNWKYMNC